MLKHSLALTVVLAGLPLSAQDDSGQDRGAKLYEAQLVRAGDLTGGLGSLGTAGKDPLRNGVVEVRGRRVVEVRLSGAAPVKSYELFYCQFPVADCKSLGTLETKDNGSASKVLDFKGDGNGWTGIFYLAGGTEGGGAVQFVGGWMLDAVQSTEGGSQEPSKVSVKGAVKLVDTTAKTFKIENFTPVITVTPDTRFLGHRDFLEMQLGQVVEVDGYLNSDGSVTAVSVKYDKPANDTPSDPPGKPGSPGKPDDKPGKG
jgi:hypothetical protein